jgi:hypothetical protein
MARSATRVRSVEEALLQALARLAGVAPTEITVLSEDSDWGLVGGDLRNAMETAEAKMDEPASDDREELVEA